MSPRELDQLPKSVGPHLRLVAASWVGDRAGDVPREAFLKPASRRTTSADSGGWLCVVTRRLAMKTARKDNKSRFDERMFAATKPDATETDTAARLNGKLVAEGLNELEPELAETVVALCGAARSSRQPGLRCY